MKKEDKARSKKIWQGLNEATGESKPYPDETLDKAFALIQKQLNEEDPETPVLCSCHSLWWPSRDVDMWGLCPRGRE